MLITYLTSVADSTASWDLDELLERIGQGDTAALHHLYEATARAIYGYALSIVKNAHDAQDVLHDSYLAIVKGSASYRRGKAKAWMYTIVHNRCMQTLREQQKATTMPQEDWLSLIDERAGISSEDRCVLSACMAQLSGEERRIVVLHALSGFRHREIASLLQMPLSTVLSKYNRALKKLRTILEKGEQP